MNYFKIDQEKKCAFTHAVTQIENPDLAHKEQVAEQ